MTREPNHRRLGEDVAHMRLTRPEIECLLAALEIAGSGDDDPETLWESFDRVRDRLLDLRKALG